MIDCTLRRLSTFVPDNSDKELHHSLVIVVYFIDVY